MPPVDETYDLNELASAADVTPRTIRYYVQQGLLPSPGTRGPGTRYDRAHLDRLQLIRRLQRQHLPLAEIRRRLETLDDAGVREALQRSPAAPTGSSALEYVREVLSTHSAPVTSGASPVRAAGARAPIMAQLRAALPAGHLGAKSIDTQQSITTTRSTRSTWERIPLAPDVELHVRRPLSREQNRQVERLIEAARDLFAEES